MLTGTFLPHFRGMQKVEVLTGLTLNHLVHVVANVNAHHNILYPFVYKGLYMYSVIGRLPIKGSGWTCFPTKGYSFAKFMFQALNFVRKCKK